MRRILAFYTLAYLSLVTPYAHSQTAQSSANRPQVISTAASSVTPVDLPSTPVARPAAALHSGSHREIQALGNQFGFPEPVPSFSIRFDRDPNPDYKKTHPFPEVTLESLFPDAIYNIQSNQVGLRSVRAITRSWMLAPNASPKEFRQTVWQWDVPESLRQLWYSETYRDGTNQDWALCLYPPKETQIPAVPVEPQLFYFDVQSGLKWQVTIPLSQLVDNIPLARPVYFAARDIQLGITSDGSRILALITCPERHTTLLSVFDNNGMLLKTSQFEGCSALPSGQLSWQLLRSNTGQTHVIALRHQFDSRGDVSLLVNKDGDVITRFENEEGKAVQILQVSDKFALAQKVQNGHTAHYILPLP